MVTYYKGKQLSASIVSKYGVSTAQKLADQTYTSGTLRQGGDGRAPDGGAIGDYPKGWRFLPQATKEQHEILKKNPKVVEAMKALHSITDRQLYTNCHTDAQCRQVKENYDARQHKIINDAHYALVIAPQIKAQEEAIARKEEEERLAIATLKMRIQELEKRPTPTPTPTPAPAVTSSLPIIPIIIIAVIVGFFLLRRRA